MRASDGYISVDCLPSHRRNKQIQKCSRRWGDCCDLIHYKLWLQNSRKEVNVMLKREAEYFGDIVILPFIDRYELVVLKTIAICEYGVSHSCLIFYCCSSANILNQSKNSCMPVQKLWYTHNLFPSVDTCLWMGLLQTSIVGAGGHWPVWKGLSLRWKLLEA